MEELIKKYANKLVEHGLCDKDMPIVAGLEVELVWNRKDDISAKLEEIFKKININSLIFSKPSEPYFSIINYLAKGVSEICPEDCETRTFLHSIPVIHDFDLDEIVTALKQKKGVIIPNYGIITYGTISPEQAFVVFSSICFSSYVKFFNDYYYDVKHRRENAVQKKIFSDAIGSYKGFLEGSEKNVVIEKGPIEDSETVINAIAQAGKLTVDFRLVDSFFGNISFRLEDTIYISQTGSSLDELLGCIDPCPIDDSTCTGITASSEFSAHKDIYLNGDVKSILHGHPKFSVIMSMICDDETCEFRGQCHIKCPKKRFVKDIPIVPGEVGTGPYGLCNTLPPAIKDKRGAIVYGHGLFTIGKKPDFIDPFYNLLKIEHMCFDEFLSLF